MNMGKNVVSYKKVIGKNTFIIFPEAGAVIGTTKYHKRGIRKTALLHPNDIFDEQLGIDIATERIMDRIEDIHIKELKGNVKKFLADADALDKQAAKARSKARHAQAELMQMQVKKVMKVSIIPSCD